MSPDVRMALSGEAIDRVYRTLSCGGAVCTVCETEIVARHERSPSVLVLRGPDGPTQVRFAHERCAESRVIELDRRPVPAGERPAADTSRRRQAAAWALCARHRKVPTVVLACDAARLAQLDVRGQTLVDALRLDGLRGGSGLQTFQPPRYHEISLTREASVLWLVTEYGSEPLQLASLQLTLALLMVAAHQRELLLVLGAGLELASGTLARTEQLLCDSEAVAARVRFEDAELAGRPLRSARRSVVSLLAPGRRRPAPARPIAG